MPNDGKISGVPNKVYFVFYPREKTGSREDLTFRTGDNLVYTQWSRALPWTTVAHGLSFKVAQGTRALAQEP